MSNPKHAPTPYDFHYVFTRRNKRIVIYDAVEFPIATVRGCDEVTAEFIVQACNSHTELRRNQRVRYDR